VHRNLKNGEYDFNKYSEKFTVEKVANQIESF